MHRPRVDTSVATADAAAPVLRTAFSRAGERRFFGFVFDPANLNQKFTVEIMVDGYPIKVLRADSYVYELATEQVGDGCYGFSIFLQDTIVAECAIVEARLANLGTPVGAPIAQGGAEAVPIELRRPVVRSEGLHRRAPHMQRPSTAGQ